MLAELNEPFQRIEMRRTEILRFVKSLSNADRSSRLSPSEWSPLQTLDHLIVYEELMREWIDSAPNANLKTALKGRLFVGLMGGLMRSRLRLPTLPELQPSDESNLDSLEPRWDAARDSLHSKLEGVTQATQHNPYRSASDSGAA